MYSFVHMLNPPTLYTYHGGTMRPMQRRLFIIYGDYAIHCKKRLAIFSSPAGMLLTKLSLAGENNIPGQVEVG
jgi:hypothetical protein